MMEINEIRKRTVILDYEGEEFYRLIDPMTNGTIEGYLISINGNILSNKCSKYGEYNRRKIVVIKNKRSHIKLSKGTYFVQRYISDLVAGNFLTNPRNIKPDLYTVNGNEYYRYYKDPNSWYIMFKDGDVTNHKLPNILYVNYRDYIRHCAGTKQKVIIKNADKELMIKIYEENDVSKAFISKLFGLDSSTFSRIYNKYKK